ncbi:hypothetical protein VNO77_26836 [Canavalia gladiata]|uniref:Non-specific serine/threonine protein kinase n=1 Tax=Canavalia gladiata TaxID=3824 RepID=A0AAN9KT25_CANGL
MVSNKVVLQIVCSCSFCFMPIFSILTITPNQSIQYDDTLVSLAGTFEAGFFSFGNPQRHYFGIWYRSISPRTIVWVANRHTPLQNSTIVLKLTHQGALVIVDASKGTVWASKSSRIAEKPVVQLLDSGNLVVKDEGNLINVLWQSFDYPGETLLAGMKLESNLETGPYKSLTSWRDTEDPVEGEFSLHIDPHGLPQLVITKGSAFYNRLPSYFLQYEASKFWNFSFGVIDKEAYYEVESLNKSIVARTVLLPTGVSQHLHWSDQTQSWEAIATFPRNQCDYYAVCGANSNCKITNNPICQCLQGFIPQFQAKWVSLDWSGGCVRRIKLNCNGGDGFLKYTRMKLPDTSFSWFNKSLSLDECETLCLNNCSCSAYANLDIRHDGSGCVLWFGNIMDLREGLHQGQDIYIRLAHSEIDHIRNKGKFTKKKLAGILVGIITFTIGLGILGMATRAFTQKKKKTGIINKIVHWQNQSKREDMNLSTTFKFSTIFEATNHFSDSNKLGEGGFGPVYKISDFGMARTFGRDQTEANTNRVMGTYGYISPEYAVHGSFSIKSDVFSFGVIVLEIISGRKNRGFCDPENHLNLLGHAWRSKGNTRMFFHCVPTHVRIRLLGSYQWPPPSQQDLVVQDIPCPSLDFVKVHFCSTNQEANNATNTLAKHGLSLPTQVTYLAFVSCLLSRIVLLDNLSV